MVDTVEEVIQAQEETQEEMIIPIQRSISKKQVNFRKIWHI